MRIHEPASAAALTEPLGEVFTQRGYDGATLTHLAQATGLSKASLYHHFPGGKAEMAAALLRQACTQAQQLAYDKLASNRPVASRLAAYLKGYERYTDSGNRACLVWMFAQAPMTPVAGQAKLALRGWHTALAGAFAEITKPKRANRLAAQLLAELNGALVSATVLDEPEALQRTLRRWHKRVRSISDKKARRVAHSEKGERKHVRKRKKNRKKSS